MTPEATTHAETLAHAVTELLRYAREGASTDRYPFGLDDIVGDVSQALLFMLRIEVHALTEDDAPEKERDQQLAAALAKWMLDNGVEVAL